jgi:hypothetical protein
VYHLEKPAKINGRFGRTFTEVSNMKNMKKRYRQVIWMCLLDAMNDGGFLNDNRFLRLFPTNQPTKKQKAEFMDEKRKIRKAFQRKLAE